MGSLSSIGSATWSRSANSLSACLAFSIYPGMRGLLQRLASRIWLLSLARLKGDMTPHCVRPRVDRRALGRSGFFLVGYQSTCFHTGASRLVYTGVFALGGLALHVSILWYVHLLWGVGACALVCGTCTTFDVVRRNKMMARCYKAGTRTVAFCCVVTTCDDIACSSVHVPSPPVDARTTPAGDDLVPQGGRLALVFSCILRSFRPSLGQAVRGLARALLRHLVGLAQSARC